MSVGRPLPSTKHTCTKHIQTAKQIFRASRIFLLPFGLLSRHLLKDDRCYSHTEEKSRQGHGVHSRRDRSVTFPQITDNITSSLVNRIIMKTLHLMQRMSQQRQRIYVCTCFALAPKVADFILHTALLGTITPIMSIIVTIYLYAFCSLYRSL